MLQKFKRHKANYIGFSTLLALYELAAYLSDDAYLPALPEVASNLHASYHLVQLTITTWFFGAASTQLILGPVTDRYGRKPVLIIGGILFIFFTLICALSNNITILLVSRFLQGATTTAIVIASYATIHELFKHKQAIQILAWMNNFKVLAPSLGPIFGTFILHMASWRWIFGILLFGVFFLLIFLWRLVPESNQKENRIPVCLSIILKQYFSILTNLSFMRSSLCLCFLFGAMIAWITAGPILVNVQFHYDSFVFGLFQACIFGNFIGGSYIIKPLMKKYPSIVLVRRGLALASCGGILSLLLSIIFPTMLLGTIFSMMLIAGGAGLCFPILNRLSIEASTEPMGARMAMLSTLITGAGMLGSFFISCFYNGTLFSLGLMLSILSGASFLLKISVWKKSSLELVT